jgi:hypothetical protein
MKRPKKELSLDQAIQNVKKFDKNESKEQGQSARSGNRGRSVGSEYAMAVDVVKEQARSMRGSQVGFLGVEKKNIEPKELASNDKLSECKRREARKKERK